ncbi:MAG: hypothetical protein KAW56_01195 [Candidatus Marinimicrobia bacterium]|nr:hypothetical protein [Candidatus Neomarinimicrobiota bacterium]
MEYEEYLKEVKKQEEIEKTEKARKKIVAKKKFDIYFKKYQSIRYKTDDKYRLDNIISRSIRRALKNSNRNKENHWKSILGYTIKELKRRLISTIPNGYTWQDYIDGKLELDHLIPVRYFDYKNKSDIEFRRSWGLYNLRLLPKKLNRIKSGSLYPYNKADCLPCPR